MDYKLTLTKAENAALGWAANRYESARVLFDGMRAESCEGMSDTCDTDCDHAVTFAVSEPLAWEYRDALEAEDGSPIVPPCIGGNLAEKLVILWNRIV